MSAALIILVLALAAPAEHAPARVFFARAQASGVSADEARVIEGAVLTAARAHATRFDALGHADVQGVLDAEAARAALGCDVSECASEIADAVGAELLVTTHVGHVGDTWVVTLTLVQRSTMQVLAREQVQRAGPRVDVVLDGLPQAVRVLLDPPRPPSALGVAGVVGLSAGAVAAVGGTVLVAVALWLHAEGMAARDGGDLVGAGEKRALGEPLYYSGYGLVGGGAAALVVGAAALVVAGAE